MEDLFLSGLANVPEAVGAEGEGGGGGHRGRGGEVGHSCGARSPRWSRANADKDLGVLVFLLCPYAVFSRLCACAHPDARNVTACEWHKAVTL